MTDSNLAVTCVLTAGEKAAVENIIQSRVPGYRPESYQEFMSGCRMAAEDLPVRIHEWRDQVISLDVGLIRNLPIDIPLRITPTVKYAADDDSMLADAVIGTVSALFGTIYTIEGKGKGRHIHNMYPVIGDEYTQLASSSKVELEWHTEEAFHPARPNWLGLLCLRADREVPTRVARARDLPLQPALRSSLNESHFKLRIDETYSKDTSSTFVTTSILAGPTTNPEIVLDPAYTVYQDEAQVKAVTAVISAAEQVDQVFTLVEGDMLVFNNRRVIHARGAFQPRMDGTDRWLKRVFILDSSDWISKLTNGVIAFEIG